MCLCRITVLLFTLTAGVCHSQIAEKIPTKLLNGPDGIVMDANGNLFIANWGKKGDGTTVIKITAKGDESVFLDNLKAPDGVTFDHQGSLYVSCFGSGEVIRVKGNEPPEVIASGLDHPSDLKFSDNGDLYVSSFGNFNGTKVYRIKNKTVETFLDSLKIPLGLAFRKNVLYVSTFADNKIFSIDTNRNKTVFAQLPSHAPGYFQYLAFDKEGNLYCPSYGHNTIYRILPTGIVDQLQLHDQQENPLTPNGPNSIVIVNDVLYFTEFNTNSLYKVKLR
jgi:sugar lactone lactonase YvrE